MTRSATAALYSPAMLALAVELADHPLDETSAVQAQTRSRTCGSTVNLSVALDGDQCIGALGLRVSACAVGQAAAAIFARDAIGRDWTAIVAARRDIEDWLAGTGNRPDWSRLEMLDPALPHPGRHEAILLPWKAAEEALSNAADAR
ncbi:MAG: iron-sulfur cluster assembly scaffold protein [Erythrobacter sp.]|nr:iron-sulfur cluster assembly scaffold protein [Erythrobacter sp.]